MIVAEPVSGIVQNEGSYREVFDASALPSGVYFCTLKTPEYAVTKQFVVLR